MPVTLSTVSSWTGSIGSVISLRSFLFFVNFFSFFVKSCSVVFLAHSFTYPTMHPLFDYSAIRPIRSLDHDAVYGSDNTYNKILSVKGLFNEPTYSQTKQKPKQRIPYNPHSTPKEKISLSVSPTRPYST